MALLSESVVEEAALGWFREIGYLVIGGADMQPGENSLRETHKEILFPTTLREALSRLNPELPAEAIDDAMRKVQNPEGPTLETRNRAFHRMAADGVTVEYRGSDGAIWGAQVRVFDFDDPDSNDWIAVNQFTVSENDHSRRPDIVVFVNGLPLAVIELKSPVDENATISSAWRQIQTYKEEIPSLFVFNLALVVSDGIGARIGTLTAGLEWFKRWRTIEGESPAPTFYPELQVLVEGVFEKNRFCELLRDFTVFEDDGGGALAKKMAGYHQFHAVRVAVAETLRAARLSQETRKEDKDPYSRHGGDPGDRRVGVVWHTQGSGKSLTMVFYAGRIIREPAMENPTVVVLTDRNDLDNQLFGTFSRCGDLLRQPPVQAESREDLRSRLSVESGGVIFTTIQKFFPDEKGSRHATLSRRRNIVVIADEAHRSQYEFEDGFAGHVRDALPNASFIGFTGTPIELRDANTRAVFGDYISVYDIERAVEDEATVPIYYESRLAKVVLDEDERPRIDPDFEEATEGEEIERKEKLKTRWAQLEAIIGTEKRLGLVARDIVEHFETRLGAISGKAMIVCMSRRICVDLYEEIARLRPDWHHEDDEKGIMKIVMTGSASDPPNWQTHIRNKTRREALAKRFRDSDDRFQVVIVRDMWLTGFDAPSLHTMYLDKPMRGHGLMQAIARVNRVFRDKPGGLVVDYLGISNELKNALANYTQSGGRGKTTLDQKEAVAVMTEKYEICLGLFHGFDWSGWAGGSAEEKLSLLPQAQEHILAQEDGKERCIRCVRELSCAFALSVPNEKALGIRDDLGFFQAVGQSLAKRSPDTEVPDEKLDHAVRQIISRAVAPEGIVDIFAAAGLKKPNISILSDEFLSEVGEMKQRNLAVELLQKLLKSEISARRRKNIVQSRSFTEMLEQTIRRYQNRSIEAAAVVEELIELAREMREAAARGEKLGLSEEELAFYDALETNDSAVRILGDQVLRAIAQELVETVRKNLEIDWTLRESVRAKLRLLVKKVLRRHGYPPDKQEKATRTVLEQAELLSAEWVT
ncbi:MAG: type I restriction endonuclease subunit R [Candidatus Dadabacteria bacterium]|nr:type I restriction endonuclease subunit R [Candidatus Dadabacteria bacterium]MDE0291207.1 type I restriction endonuclease subunit R [Candidatus Dadabacteria bacterium]